MTNLEIDKALALAIGWEPEQIWNRETSLLLPMRFDGFEHWHRFSHRDWNVIGPIAERYDCFPVEVYSGRWFSCVGNDGKNFTADTPQRAIALAVIGTKK